LKLFGLPPSVSPIASRVAVPVYSGGNQIGKATSDHLVALLKKMIALAHLKRDFVRPGTKIRS